ncbi:hypothetical protein FTV88_1530 [Heliorestis convoluta]|uniref:Uncharacterized protein n=1 Tax=Heliorestis convoluta TaxID=356322 RepID=A0A5Q2N5V4_9FIRM|nr:hypothetical protein FTV88_1530 [Heliorestis convoluta]
MVVPTKIDRFEATGEFVVEKGRRVDFRYEMKEQTSGKEKNG